MSTLEVNTINEYSSGSGVTIDGVLLKDNSLHGLAFDDHDVWCLTANTGDGSDGDITSNWARPTGGSGMYTKWGTNITESSGIFSFPTTGYWYIEINVAIRTSNDPTIECQLKGTTNNSSYNTITMARQGCRANVGATYMWASSSVVLDITDVSNQKVKLEVSTEVGTVTISGSTSESRSSLQFFKLGDT